MPLLHTWSLAVEEQFYIAFPLLMILIGKQGRIVQQSTILVLAVSMFMLSVYLTIHSPGVAFYWPTRAWELLVGAGLALTETGVRPLRETASIAGSTAIIMSFFIFDRMTPFPGYAALAPVLGSAAVIYGGGQTLVGRILSQRPFVWIGLISYSLYLWHWPILVYAKQALISERLSLAQTVGCILATFLLATLSWRFVETRFRRMPMPRMRLFFGAGALVGSLTAVGIGIFVLQGLPGRFSRDSLTLAQARIAEHPDGCARVDRFLCQVGSGQARYVVWGDSHAGALSPAISNVVSGPGLYAIFNACPPLPSVTPQGLRGDDQPNCEARNRALLERIRNDRGIDIVIIAAFWSNYKFNEDDIRYLLDNLKEKYVIIVGDNPIPGFNVPKVLALNGSFKLIQPSSLPYAFKVCEDAPNVKLIELSDALCAGGKCPPQQGLRSLYGDGNHISAYAADTVITAFLREQLSRLAPVGFLAKH